MRNIARKIKPIFNKNTYYKNAQIFASSNNSLAHKIASNLSN